MANNEPFAKLFETPHGQLLAYLDETDEGEPCVHVIGAYVRGARLAAKMLGWEGDAEQAAEAALAKIDQVYAEKLTADFHRMVSGLAA